VLHLDDYNVGEVRVASTVLAVPEIEVGAMLIQHEFVERRLGPGRGKFSVMAMRDELIVKRDDVGGVQHGLRRHRITEPGLAR
jgi:hypothetical protein